MGSDRADLGPERGLGGLTNIHMDGWMYGRTFENSPLCPTGHLPFGATAQKEKVKKTKKKKEENRKKKSRAQ